MSNLVRKIASVVLAAFSLAPTIHARAAERPYSVDHYFVQIEPDLQGKSLTGSVLIELTEHLPDQRIIELDRGELSVKSVTLGGRSQPFTLEPGHLLIHLERAPRSGEHLGVRIEYGGVPRFGLEFPPGEAQLYTIFSTSQWLICNDIPSDKATVDLRLVLPAKLTVIANGTRVRQRTRPDGKQVSDWHEPHAIPTYAFGFAAGPFAQVVADHGRLKFLGDGFSKAQLLQIFRDTADMRKFFEQRSGVSYPGATYSQALVADTVGQELGEFSLLSREYGQSVLADPQALGLIAHEFAHQWWGNRVTCRDWTQFWLNEGFATFMSAAYLESRFGHQAYLDAIEKSHARYAAVQATGADHALVFDDWNHPTADDRTIVYHKGAYVLYLLREELGERAFWNGIQAYTREYLDKSVTTADFKSAMERSSQRDLSEFFRTWVYGSGGPGAAALIKPT